VRRRMCLVWSAIAAAPLVVGFGVTAAAAKGTAAKPVATLKCHITLSTMPPPGSPAVDQPPSQGVQYGPVNCRGAGSGVQGDTFKVPLSGDNVGSYVQYFGTSSIRGEFNLTPTEGSGSISQGSFESESWVGTLTVTGGTGQYAGAAGTKGVLKCTSGDTVHLRCTETMPLTKL
jgi:hypothetical protein